jgi:uncharacterized protein (DUF2164 family)
MENGPKVLYFGNFNGATSLNCTIITMLLSNIVGLDGMIQNENLKHSFKRQLWAYIIYLGQSNPTLYPFIGFDKDDHDKLVDIVKTYLDNHVEYEFFLKIDLARFINNFISANTAQVDIKIIAQVLDKLIEKVNDMDRQLVQKITSAIQH